MLAHGEGCGQSNRDGPHAEELRWELLRSLSPEEFEAQTIAPGWKVKDIAAHLLDTQLRKLSVVRDGYSREIPVIASEGDLVSFINRLNGEGVGLTQGPALNAGAQRLSQRAVL